MLLLLSLLLLLLLLHSCVLDSGMEEFLGEVVQLNVKVIALDEEESLRDADVGSARVSIQHL